MELDPAESAIVEAIDETGDETVEFLQELIRAKPVNPPGNEESAAKLIRPRLEESGFEIEEYTRAEGRPNLVARLPGGSGPTLLMTAHMDVVPVNDEDEWPCDPFSGEIIDGKLYGRGACDHKMPIAAMLSAVEALQATGTTLNGDLLFIFDSDEERGGEYGMRHVVENADLDPDLGIYAVTTSLEDDAAAYFDNTGTDNVFRANYGNQVFKVTVEGDIVHPLTAGETDSAGARVSRLLPHIADYCEAVEGRSLPLVGKPNAEITTLESEGRPGRAAPTASVHVHRYYGPSEDADDVYAEFETWVDDAASDEDLLDSVRVERIKHMPNVVVPEDHELVLSTATAAAKVRGAEPTITGIPAQAGVTWIVRELDIPMVMFGFGNVNFHHSDPEWITPTDVVDTAKAYALTYKDLLA